MSSKQWKKDVVSVLRGLWEDGNSWSQIAAMIGENKGYLYQIAHGQRTPRPALARKMGIEVPGQYVVAFHCETAEEQQRLRDIFAPFGSRRELKDALLRGEVRLFNQGPVPIVLTYQGDVVGSFSLDEGVMMYLGEEET